MIFDTIENISRYATLGEHFAEAAKLILSTDFGAMEPGRYSVDGSPVYYTVQETTTKPFSETKWEAHHQYADIQIALEDGEIIGYAPRAKLDGWQAEIPGKDIIFAENDRVGTPLIMDRRSFAIFFPQDAHRPCQAAAQGRKLRKAVVKVPVQFQ
ncbi:MAG TPA: YhcH/YjgK/YiaL family protein [Feifaniaceae bacterium]|nr:YhcH/YjgK/YiaL family protein [Feifaniaceae bacterium]